MGGIESGVCASPERLEFEPTSEPREHVVGGAPSILQAAATHLAQEHKGPKANALAADIRQQLGQEGAN